MRAVEKELVDLLDQLLEAAIENARSGGGHPDEIPLKEFHYKTCRREFLRWTSSRIKNRR
jgi:hypothetical protein